MSFKFNNIINLDCIDSTNSFVKSELANLPDGTIVFTREQTQGRGKFDRKWYGEAGSSIFCSFLTKNIQTPIDAIRFNFKFSLIVKDTLAHFAPVDNFILKWPNDILVKPHKKICGILSEYTQESVVTGIGINIKPFKLPPELETTTAFLENLTPRKIELADFQKVLIQTANHHFGQTENIPATDFPEIWFKAANIKNRKISVSLNDSETNGIIDGITDYGALILKTPDNQISVITTGDITYHD